MGLWRVYGRNSHPHLLVAARLATTSGQGVAVSYAYDQAEKDGVGHHQLQLARISARASCAPLRSKTAVIGLLL